jgi:sporulation protein YlmC with PRC-barrel domain
MAHYGTLRDYRFADRDVDDIRGSAVYGRNDEKLGKIDDVVFNHSSGDIRYVVVDTGGWLKSKKFLVPTERLRQSAKHDDDYEADLTKPQIESFPPYNEEDVKSEDRWKDYEKRYKAGWDEAPVMHRKGSDHAITPNADEIPPAPSTDIDYDPEVVNRRIIPPTANEVNIPSSGAGLGDRWSSFEGMLRNRREDLTARCSICGNRGARDDRAA